MLGKIGEILNKIGKPGIFEEVYFFPVSVPVMIITKKEEFYIIVSRIDQGMKF